MLLDIVILLYVFHSINRMINNIKITVYFTILLTLLNL